MREYKEGVREVKRERERTERDREIEKGEREREIEKGEREGRESRERVGRDIER